MPQDSLDEYSILGREFQQPTGGGSLGGRLVGPRIETGTDNEAEHHPQD